MLSADPRNQWVLIGALQVNKYIFYFQLNLATLIGALQVKPCIKNVYINLVFGALKASSS